MSGGFEACMDFTLRRENEGGYVDNPADSGGATNMGITLEGLRDWRPYATLDNLKILSESDARAYYYLFYWLAVTGSALPAGIDLMVFDFGVNHGPASSVEMLQRIIGARVDGDAGPETLKRAWCTGDVLTGRIGQLATAQLAYYASLHNVTFGRGWAARTDRRRAAALQMAASSVPPNSGLTS